MCIAIIIIFFVYKLCHVLLTCYNPTVVWHGLYLYPVEMRTCRPCSHFCWAERDYSVRCRSGFGPRWTSPTSAYPSLKHSHCISLGVETVHGGKKTIIVTRVFLQPAVPAISIEFIFLNVQLSLAVWAWSFSSICFKVATVFSVFKVDSVLTWLIQRIWFSTHTHSMSVARTH